MSAAAESTRHLAPAPDPEPEPDPDPDPDPESAETSPPREGSLARLVAEETRRRRRRRLAWVTAGLIAIGGIGIGTWAAWPRPPAVSELYRALPAQHGPLISRVSASGRLEARGTVEVGARISGTVSVVLVDYNDFVSEGDVLAHFETDLLDAQLEQSTASISAARANLRQARVERRYAKTELERSKQLHAKGIESDASLALAQTNLDQLDARIASSRAQIALQQAAVKLAETNLDHTVIRSPIDGVVLSREVEEGQTVAASLQSPTLFLLAEDLTRMKVIANVDETDIARVQEAQAATFTVDAYPRREFEARVRQVRSAPKLSGSVVTYEVVLEVDNTDLALKPGMTTSVKVEVARRDDALSVPNGALRFTPPGQEKDPAREGVWVLDDEGPHFVEVAPGITDGKHTEVIEVLDGELATGTPVLVDLTPLGREAMQP